MPARAAHTARVVLAVGAGIAAYKAVELCRRLVDAGVHVAPVLTPDATRFVGEVTFSALASEPARTSLWEGPAAINHTALGQTADAVVVAPATADLLARMAAGMADDLVTATLLATRAPVVVCPAMHTEMWEHPAVQDNLDTLRHRGVVVVPPEVGRLAGGDTGLGRMAEPATIAEAVLGLLAPAPGAGPGAAGPVGTGPVATARRDLVGHRVVVTAGGTREPLDPVRFLTNRSSGKQGHALAEAAAARGAEVVLVTTAPLGVTPAAEGDRGPGTIVVVRVETAADMDAAVRAEAPSADVVVMAAAVADFRPKVTAPRKLVKDDGVPEIVLEPTPDILAGLGARRRPGQVLVGFAAETDDAEARGRRKLARKGADLLVVNDVTAPGVGFDHDTNAVTILDAEGGAQVVTLRTKRAVADAVFDRVSARLDRPAGPESLERKQTP